MKRFINNKIIIGVVVLLVATGLLSAGDNYFEVNKQIEILTSLYKELNTNYVDPLNAEKLFNQGIESMLKSLDPYTVFYDEAEQKDYKFQTTGKYGGIGASVIRLGTDIYIAEPYVGFPAYKNGLQAGDKIMSIDGVNCLGKTVDEISKYLRGEPKTNFNITISKIGSNQLVTTNIVREEITLKSMPFASMASANVGYIRYTQFTEASTRDVYDALIKLKKENPQLNGWILDLRGNPGGLLNEAVNMVNLFIERGEDIVFTKGNMKEWNKTYKATKNPVDATTPLVVLTNKGAASASEIVSGAIQDLDRGVVMGQRTFGKGLVQTTKNLPYNTRLKITTAKYYIPSGRCIQAINYAQKNEDGSVAKIPDSLRHSYKTKNGRTVWDGGGVEPDVLLEPQLVSPLVSTLLIKGVIFEFANKYFTQHNTIASAKGFELSDNDYNDFINFATTKPLDYKTETEKAFEEFKKEVILDNSFDKLKTNYEQAFQALSHDKKQDLIKNKKIILPLLASEIIHRYYYQNGKFELALKNDEEIISAIKLLENQQLYYSYIKK